MNVAYIVPKTFSKKLFKVHSQFFLLTQAIIVGGKKKLLLKYKLSFSALGINSLFSKLRHI